MRRPSKCEYCKKVVLDARECIKLKIIEINFNAKRDLGIYISEFCLAIHCVKLAILESRSFFLIMKYFYLSQIENFFITQKFKTTYKRIQKC